MVFGVIPSRKMYEHNLDASLSHAIVPWCIEGSKESFPCTGVRRLELPFVSWPVPNWAIIVLIGMRSMWRRRDGKTRHGFCSRILSSSSIASRPVAGVDGQDECE